MHFVDKDPSSGMRYSTGLFNLGTLTFGPGFFLSRRLSCTL